MDKTIKEFNPDTALIERDGSLFIRKRISADDLGLFQRLRKIESPFLARVFEIGLDGDCLCAYIEYIPGKALSEVLRESGSFDLKNTIAVTLDICEGLSALHENGIVHRDVNPSNVVIRPDGRAVIIDFGISRLEKAGKSSDTAVLGTAGYAAPEQFGFSQTDSRSDVFSVGVLMNVLLTGKAPNEEQTGTALDSLIARCTRIKPEERFSGVDELSDGLILTFNRLFPKEKIRRKPPVLKRILLSAYYLLASVFVFLFVSGGKSSDAEGVFMALLCFFALFLPPFFVNHFNSRQGLFFYRNLRIKRIALTISSVLLCFITAFIIFIYITQKWTGG